MHECHTTPGVGDTVEPSLGNDLAQLLASPVESGESVSHRTRIFGVVVGTLVGFAENGARPLVTYTDQPGSAALVARATIDLHGAHVGRPAVLMFEEGDPHRPIVLGCLVDESTLGLPEISDQIHLEADGQRLVVAAKERIVLRCGKASITLTKEGKLILQGEYVSSQSSGVLRIKGGSVQIN
jgi:hypothetical protein